MGLFDAPYVAKPEMANVLVHNKEAQALSLQAAREGIVLLKNQNNLLPLNSKNIQKIAIIGPNAKELKSLSSRYGPSYSNITNVFDGIKAAFPASVNITYAKGIDHVDKNFPESDVEDFEVTTEENAMIDEAVELASKADVIILAVGDNDKTVGESKSRVSLNLPGKQDFLVRKIAALNKPTVLLLVGGRPVTINFAEKNIPAILETWYLGEKTGLAIADVLFGNYNPGGKLPVPFPKSAGQIPMSFPYKPGALGNGDADVKGFLYPFGFGLSYTKFQYSDLKVDATMYPAKGEVAVTFKVKNIGEVKGDEVVQLYINDELSSVTTYLKRLKGFDRIPLQPSEEKLVQFILSKSDFSLLNQDMKRVVEPGWFKIMIGASSEDIKLTERLNLK